MAKYAFVLKSTKYGVPTGTNSMPAELTALPDTVKGTVTFSETDPTTQSFWVDQKTTPIRKTGVELGELSVTMQFYDMSYDVLKALKGGTSDETSWEAPVDYSDIELALQLELESGQYIKFYNAYIQAKIAGSGSRDGMLYVEMTATAQLTSDLKGAARIEDIPAGE